MFNPSVIRYLFAERYHGAKVTKIAKVAVNKLLIIIIIIIISSSSSSSSCCSGIGSSSNSSSSSSSCCCCCNEGGGNSIHPAIAAQRQATALKQRSKGLELITGLLQ